ncbi:alpha/beta fold hydrolase [Actinoplanes sp. NPDC049802]|uniref:alpha/beta fold hydrolase n=1 Tax=Actinoplanes sp. NPDC049802 TaxID=3154742 RepID=UPI0033FEEB12
MSATVTSRDGTRIAYELTGSGPVLVLIDAAGHFRANSGLGELAGLLAGDFTVLRYDRRGRGESGDTAPYAPAREVEDLAALIDATGGSAALYGYSSGGLLALHAAAGALPVPGMVLLEPPVADEPGPKEFTARLRELGGAEAVEFFLGGIVPGEVLAGMRGTPHWDAMVSVAPTLAYDCELSEATDAGLLGRVTTPVLVLDSAGSSGDLTGMAASAAALLPNATHRSLPGEWHGVPAPVLAPVLRTFLRSVHDDR